MILSEVIRGILDCRLLIRDVMLRKPRVPSLVFHGIIPMTLHNYTISQSSYFPYLHSFAALLLQFALGHCVKVVCV